MALREQKPREPIRDPNWVFTFGKYKGTKLYEVMCADSKYIDWLIQNTDFDVHADLFADVEARYQQGMRELFQTKT